MDSKVGIALFGLGRAGSIHFGNILANYRLKLLYLVEKDKEKAHSAITKYGLEATVKVITPEHDDTVYNDPSVRAVIVCAPTFEHEEIVIKSLQHGKGVFCEKPISESLDGTRRCYEEAEKAGKPLLCSFNRRFDPSIRKLKHRVSAGEVGEILQIKSTARDHPLPPLDYLKISGGFFHDCAVHDLDLICWILGEYPLNVYSVAHAHIQPIKDMNDVDNAAIMMKFPSNVIATIDISRHACYGYDQRCEVFGMNGMLLSDNQRITELKSFNNLGSSQEVLKHSFPQRYAESYVNALDAFIDILQGKTTNEITKQHTMTISMLASACEESYKTGKQIQFQET